MKYFLIVLFIISICFAHASSNHIRFMQRVPFWLEKAGYIDEAKIISDNMSNLIIFVVAPDESYPQLKIPDDMMPEWIKEYDNGYIGKWEHTLPNDVPNELTLLLKDISVRFDFKFRYADETIKDWMDSASYFWNINDKYMAMRYLAYSCHLIQDLTIPMHCKATGNIKDIWDLLNHNNPNHNKFEQYCSSNWIESDKNFNINDFSVEKTPSDLANKSRNILKYCDGIGKGEIFNYPPLCWIFPFWVENYSYVCKISNQRGEEYTARMIHYFFNRIKK